MTLLQRLSGCPTGATRHALLACGHTDREIAEETLAGKVRREVRSYANPKNFRVEWFYVNDK